MAGLGFKHCSRTSKQAVLQVSPGMSVKCQQNPSIASTKAVCRLAVSNSGTRVRCAYTNLASVYYFTTSTQAHTMYKSFTASSRYPRNDIENPS